MRIHSVLSITHCDPVSPGVARGHAAGSKHQGLSLTGLGKEGAICGSTSLRPLGELAYLRTAYSHYSPVMIATFRPESAGRVRRIFFSSARSGHYVPTQRNFAHCSCRVSTQCRADWMRIHSVLSITHCDPVSPGVARGHAAGSKHQGLSLTGLGKEGAICWLDQPTTTG